MPTTTNIDNHEVLVTGQLIKTARLAQEWFEDLDEPEQMVAALTRGPVRADILTFWQRLPDLEPKYSHYTEWEEIAALPVTTYEHWWSEQIKSRTRGLI